MSCTRINIVGCGRVGKTIGYLLKDNNLVQVDGILNKSFSSANDATKFIGQGKACISLDDLPLAEIYFITTRDDAIQHVCDQLVSKKLLKPGSIIVHCSGSLTSGVLASAKLLNCYTASIHPIKSFAHPEFSIKNFNGTYCAIEGDEEATIHITRLFEKIGGIVFKIKKDAKKLYHAAGVLANNYLVTLHHLAVNAYNKSGVDHETASKITSMLMKDALQNLQGLDHTKALTGPLQRGDVQTIKNHVSALAEDKRTKKIYTALGFATLELTKHSEKTKNELMEALALDAAQSTDILDTAKIRSRL